jgi:hypothetical protein
MHCTLFALYEPQVELIHMMLSIIFHDLCCVIDEHWDMLVKCTSTNLILDSVDVGHLKDQLLVGYISCENSRNIHPTHS